MIFVRKSLQLSLFATACPSASRPCVHKYPMCFILPQTPRLDVNLLAVDEPDVIRTGAIHTPSHATLIAVPRSHRKGAVLVFGILIVQELAEVCTRVSRRGFQGMQLHALPITT